MTATMEVEHYKSEVVLFGAILVALNILDVLTTYAVFSVGGIEANPIAKLFIYNFWLALAIKTLIPLKVAYSASRKPTRLIRNAIMTICAIYGLVIHNNLIHLARYTFSS